MSNSEDFDKKSHIVEGASVQEKEVFKTAVETKHCRIKVQKPSTSSMSGDRPQRRGGRRPGRRGGKMDERAKLERSRQSARECRARKKLRYQYLEDLVANREKAVFALRDELELYKQWCIQMDQGLLPLGLLKLYDDSEESDPDGKKGSPLVVTKADSNGEDLKPCSKGDHSTYQQVNKGDNSSSSNIPHFVSSIVSNNSTPDKSRTQPSPSSSGCYKSNSNQNVNEQNSNKIVYRVKSNESQSHAIPTQSTKSPVASGSSEIKSNSKQTCQVDNVLASSSRLFGASNFEFGTLDENLKAVSKDAEEYDVLENLFDSVDEDVDLDDMESVKRFLVKQMERKRPDLPTIVEENEV